MTPNLLTGPARRRGPIAIERRSWRERLVGTDEEIRAHLPKAPVAGPAGRPLEQLLGFAKGRRLTCVPVAEALARGRTMLQTQGAPPWLFPVS